MTPLAAHSTGEAATVGLQDDALDENGSLAIPLTRIVSCKARRRWDFGAYLSIRFVDDRGELDVASWMTEAGVRLKTMRLMEADLLEAQSEALNARRSPSWDDDRGSSPRT